MENLKLIYTDHAIAQMHDRRITEAEVEECLKNYDTSYTDKCGNPICIGTLTNGRRIKVVVKKENHRVIITAADR